MYKIFFITILFVWFPLVSFADWNRAPNNINNTTYSQNLHAARGHDKLARIGNNLFAITPYHSGGREEVWKSTDDGNTWLSMGYFFTIEGISILSSDDNYIYIFGRYNGQLVYVKFLPTATIIPSPVNMVSIGGVYSTVYATVSSTIDSSGRLIVTTHETDNGNDDRIVQTISSDHGATWSPLKVLMSPNSGFGLYNAQCAVSTDDKIYCAWGTNQYSPDSSNDRKIYFSYSSDHGQTYSTPQLMYVGAMINTHVLADGDNKVYLFGQNQYNHAPGNGLVLARSYDGGQTWDSWRLIEPTCYYADQTAALTSDGHIIIAMRSDQGTGENGTVCGESCRQTILESSNSGTTWTLRQWLDNLPQVGTQSSLRYHTWYTGGGILEWSWMQYSDASGTTTPIYYSNNSDIQIAEAVIDGQADVRADVDNNSTINTTDAMLTFRNSLGLNMSGTNWYLSATTGDVNCDGVSNSTDAMLILRKSLGLDMTGAGWCGN